MEPNRITDGFRDKTIFITGGTGFMGKVLIEKLLRSCYELKQIYMLIRSKKGKDPNERIKEMFNNPLYDVLKKQRGEDITNKVVAIAGDVMEPDLGISAADRKRLAEEVEIIYHCAATIRFDDPLKKAVLINVRGTKYMLELARECHKLMAFGHMSTAYCHLKERVLYEKLYPPPADPHNIIRAVEWMDEEIVDTITPKLLGDCPNTYAFTKGLGEGLVNECMDELPIVIFRPSVVIPIWKEPLPGWTDNINGPTGLLIGAGKGVIRTMYCDQTGYADFLPVDIAANGVIAAMWAYIEERKCRVFHLTSSAEYKFTWQEIIDLGRNIINTKMPLNGVVWYPGGSMKSSRLVHNLAVIFFHYLPALFLDMIIFLSGHKPLLWKIQKRISKGFEVFEYYANKQWDFNNENAMIGRALMNDREKAAFKVDGVGLDMEQYFTDCIHAARIYILKEYDDTLPAARRHMRIMYWVDKICKTLILVAFGYMLLKYVLCPITGVSL